jgi:hypothetical protein
MIVRLLKRFPFVAPMTFMVIYQWIFIALLILGVVWFIRGCM